MREIKFRLWDKDSNRMVLEDFNLEYIIENQENLKHLFLMQFIGKQDKNGVDIYEDDIVQNSVIKGTVVFYGTKFVVFDKNGDYIILDKFQDDLEIIGNIHENPEIEEILKEVK